MVSARTGLSSVLVSRLVLGRAGGKWASVLLGGTQVGWSAITVAVLADLFGTALGLETTWPIIVVGGVLMAVTAYRGFRGIEVLSWISVPLMLALYVWSRPARSARPVAGAACSPPQATARCRSPLR